MLRRMSKEKLGLSDRVIMNMCSDLSACTNSGNQALSLPSLGPGNKAVHPAFSLSHSQNRSLNGMCYNIQDTGDKLCKHEEASKLE